MALTERVDLIKAFNAASGGGWELPSQAHWCSAQTLKLRITTQNSQVGTRLPLIEMYF